MASDVPGSISELKNELAEETPVVPLSQLDRVENFEPHSPPGSGSDALCYLFDGGGEFRVGFDHRWESGPRPRLIELRWGSREEQAHAFPENPFAPRATGSLPGGRLATLDVKFSSPIPQGPIRFEEWANSIELHRRPEFVEVLGIPTPDRLPYLLLGDGEIVRSHLGLALWITDASTPTKENAVPVVGEISRVKSTLSAYSRRGLTGPQPIHRTALLVLAQNVTQAVMTTLGPSGDEGGVVGEFDTILDASSDAYDIAIETPAHVQRYNLAARVVAPFVSAMVLSSLIVDVFEWVYSWVSDAASYVSQAVGLARTTYDRLADFLPAELWTDLREVVDPIVERASQFLEDAEKTTESWWDATIGPYWRSMIDLLLWYFHDQIDAHLDSAHAEVVGSESVSEGQVKSGITGAQAWVRKLPENLATLDRGLTGADRTEEIFNEAFQLSINVTSDDDVSIDDLLGKYSELIEYFTSACFDLIEAGVSAWNVYLLTETLHESALQEIAPGGGT